MSAKIPKLSRNSRAPADNTEDSSKKSRTWESGSTNTSFNGLVAGF